MIDTFLFDMGNVLVYFSHAQMCRQIAEVCRCDAEEVRVLMFDRQWENELERGELTDQQLQQRLESHFQRAVPIDELVSACSEIFSLNAPMVPVLQALKRRGKRLVLLSNTSRAHIAYVRREYEILDDFDDFVLSCDVGSMKPSSAIYQAALAKIQCPPERCFYTDDIDPYIVAARQHRLQAEVFTDAATLVGQLAARGIQID